MNRARELLAGRHPVIVAGVLVAGAVIVYELGTLLLAVVPFLLALAIGGRHSRGARRAHTIVADLGFAGAGYLLGSKRRRPSVRGDELTAAKIATERERRALIRATRRARLEAARASRDELERAYKRGVIDGRLDRGAA